jgi:extracellular factor (EF) 3-hydroxypalmitic acid methyl ester biosynthesis protein
METKLGSISSASGESFIVFRNSQGNEARGTLLRLTRYVGVFEVYNPYSILQLSEVLGEVKLYLADRLVYSGRAVVSSLVNTGIMLLCEATLEEEGWLDVDMFSPFDQLDQLRADFTAFVKESQKLRQILPGYKVAVADVQNFFLDLRRWLEQVELGIRSSPSGDRLEMERGVINGLGDQVLPSIDALFGSFETVSDQVPSEVQPLHRTYVKRQLHPFVLCAPFAYRTFRKPLGYAGDYEMVNMILRDPHEGSSLFAKVLNVWLLKQPSAEAHRNRVKYLEAKLTQEVCRVSAKGRPTRILNLGCGPAGEIQAFLEHREESNRAQFTLLDFNDETLEYTTQKLNALKREHGRQTGLHFEKRSVNQILKDSGRQVTLRLEEQYDVIYCAGLFDYLSDKICRRLMTYFYDMLAPGGFLVGTNVDASNPNRNSMDFILEWHLVYRSQAQMLQLSPEQAPPEACHVETDTTSVNLFLEVRKPNVP